MPDVHQTRTFRALGYAFSVTVHGNDALGGYVDTLLASFPASTDEPVPWVVQRADVNDQPGWELLIDGARNAATERAESLVPALVQALNALAVPSWDGVTCHAGGVARDRDGIVLPADPGAGKTTLTAGLVRAGFSYLTDEAVAFRPGTATIEPFTKPLSIDPGAWFLFPELEPRANIGSDGYKQEQWQVPPDAIRPGAAGQPCAARLVVFPSYAEGADTALVPVGRAEALVDLARNTFAFNQKSRAALDELADVIRRVDCYRLTVGTLDAAVELIVQLAEDLPALGGDDA